MADNFYFNGSLLTAPQAAVFIDDSALASVTNGGSGDLLIVGASGGGKPYTPLYFVTPQDATRTLLSGDGLRAVLRAFAPSPTVPGASRVIFVRINDATQASYTLLDGNSLNTIVVTSVDYGTYTNTIKEQVLAGSVVGKLINISLGNTTIARDNINRLGFSLTYTGTASDKSTACVGPVSTLATSSEQTTVSTTAVTGNAVAQSIQVASSAGFALNDYVLVGHQGGVKGDGSADFEIVQITSIADGTHITGIFNKAHAVGDPIVKYFGEQGLAVYTTDSGGTVIPANCAVVPFATYTTMAEVVSLLNTKFGVFAASVTGPDPSDLSANLDFTTGTGGAIVPVLLSTTTPQHFDQQRYACVLAFNDNAQPWVTAVASTVNMFANVFPSAPAVEGSATVWHYLSGGSDASPTTTQNWQTGLDTAGTVDCSVICVASGDPTVHSMLKTHVDTQSEPTFRHERIALVGGLQGLSQTTAQTNAGSLRDPRLGYVWPGIYDVDITQTAKNTILLDPWLVAAQIGGMFCGSPIQEPMTNKFITAKGVEQVLTVSNRDTLLNNGVIPLVLVPNKGFKIVRSQSTWIADTNFRRNELSTMRASDYLAQNVRTALEALIGQVVRPELITLADKVTESVLNNMRGIGIIVGDPRGGVNPAFKNIQITASGDVLYVSFEVAIAVPLNYIGISISLFPFNQTVTF